MFIPNSDVLFSEEELTLLYNGLAALQRFDIKVSCDRDVVKEAKILALAQNLEDLKQNQDTND